MPPSKNAYMKGEKDYKDRLGSVRGTVVEMGNTPFLGLPSGSSFLVNAVSPGEGIYRKDGELQRREEKRSELGEGGVEEGL